MGLLAPACCAMAAPGSSADVSMIPSGQVLDPVDIPVENFSDKPAAKRSRSPSATDPRPSQPLEQVDRRSASPHPGQSPSQGRGMARAPGGGASAPGSLGFGGGKGVQRAAVATATAVGASRLPFNPWCQVPSNLKFCRCLPQTLSAHCCFGHPSYHLLLDRAL